MRPYCNGQHYDQVFFDTNRMIREAFGEAGYPHPVPTYAVTRALSLPAPVHDR